MESQAWLTSRVQTSNNHRMRIETQDNGKVEHIHSMYVCSWHNSDSLMPAQVKFIRLLSSKNSKREAYIEVLDGRRGLAFTPPQYQPAPTRCQEQGHLGGSCLPSSSSRLAPPPVDMAHLVRQPGLLDGSNRVPTSNDGCHTFGITISQLLGNSMNKEHYI